MISRLGHLKRNQKRRVALLARIERTAARLERRRLELRSLETAIAGLERRIVGSRREPGARREAVQGHRRAQLIFNPAAGRDEETDTDRLSRIVSSLNVHGIEATIGLRTSGKMARALARRAVRDGLPLVIVAAGDGTVGDVASELIGTPTVLGLVPIGTMNNVARSLGVPLGIDDACALIGRGTTRHIDAGRVHTDRCPRGEVFLECAGVGLAAIGALVGRAFEKRRRGVLPKALRRFFEAGPVTMRVELDGTAVVASTRIVTVSNAPLMANNLLAAPEAKMDDGYLDVSVYDGMADTALAGHFLAASSHTPGALRVYRARRVRITTVGAVLARFGVNTAPERGVMEIEVLPAALSMIVGNGIGLTIPVEPAPAAPTHAGARPSSNGSGAAAAVRSASARV